MVEVDASNGVVKIIKYNMKERITEFSFPHPPIDFDKVWLHLHRLGSPLYMDTYFKTWGFKNTQKYYSDYYPTRGEFEDLHLFFKEGNWYGKYNIKYFCVFFYKKKQGIKVFK